MAPVPAGIVTGQQCTSTHINDVLEIGKVIVCPQCYSAIATRLGNMKGDYLVVDIGSKTP